MKIATTEAGLQIHTGHGITTAQSREEQAGNGPFFGIALEPQGWPAAPNQPDFPSVILRSGETYHQTTTCRFSHQG